MSGLNRGVNRERLKRKYKKFCQDWAIEKSNQRKYIEVMGDLPKNAAKLLKKPTFTQWQELLERKQKFEKEQVAKESAEKNAKIDTEWSEEEA